MTANTSSRSLSELYFRAVRFLRDLGRTANRQGISVFHTVGSKTSRIVFNLMQSVGIIVYRVQGRLPQSLGYGLYRNQYVSRLIYDEKIIQAFQEGTELPQNLGTRLDERVVEYPWAISMALLHERRSRFLDAGSTLNHEMIIHHPAIRRHDLTVLTLAPESQSFWKDGFSYVYDDLRAMPFRDGWFDAVFCISVIEHVGMNNIYYSKEQKYQENNSLDYLSAIAEIKRVLKTGGRLYLTVPFGRYEHHGWFQQFDSAMLSTLISDFHPQAVNKTFFRYTLGGWKVACENECKDLSFFHMDAGKFSKSETKQFDPDFAAAARAVACLELQK